MKFDHRHYVPCLQWKQGEYQAVSRLPDKTKRVFTPLIEVPEIGWDFESKTKAKTVDKHLARVAERIHKKWGDSFCFVDLNMIDSSERMVNGIHPVRFIFDDLRAIKSQAIPVTGLDRDKAYQDEVKNTSGKDKSGICLRVKIEQAAKRALKAEINSLLATLKIKTADCDLILDLGTPNFVPLDGFARAIEAIVRKLPDLNNWRTFAVLGTSFPETMATIKKGGELVARSEWQLYKILVATFRQAKLRLPTFGDYAISHPKIFHVDMRLAKPNATIRYTVKDHWYIVKGKNVREYKFGQYRQLSRQVLASDLYCGSVFSWGDNYIGECANGNGKTGNLTTWRQVGTNHHIEKVTQDIANFYASSNTP